jgi:hypothetical protein
MLADVLNIQKGHKVNQNTRCISGYTISSGLFNDFFELTSWPLFLSGAIFLQCKQAGLFFDKTGFNRDSLLIVSKHARSRHNNGQKRVDR